MAVMDGQLVPSFPQHTPGSSDLYASVILKMALTNNARIPAAVREQNLGDMITGILAHYLQGGKLRSNLSFRGLDWCTGFGMVCLSICRYTVYHTRGAYPICSRGHSGGTNSRSRIAPDMFWFSFGVGFVSKTLFQSRNVSGLPSALGFV